MASEIYRAQALLSSAEYLIGALQQVYDSTKHVPDALEGIKVILNTADDLIEEYINKELKKEAGNEKN